MTAPKNGHALTSEERAQLAREALAEMTPAERYAALRGDEGLDIAREQLAIARVGARFQSNAVTAGQEKAKLADERHEAIAAGRRAWTAEVDVRHELSSVQNSPIVTVRVRLGGQRFGADEPERAGLHGVMTCVVTDSVAAEATILEDCWRSHLAEKADLERLGDVENLRLLTKVCEGRGESGALWRRWRELNQPLLRKLVRVGGTLEDLVAAGTVVVAGEVQVSDQPLRTRIDP